MVRNPGDIFVPIVAAERRHRAFEDLRTSAVHVGARRLMSEAVNRMEDVDGNFVREFQTQFHARLFELACFLYLEEQGLKITRAHGRPDFLVSRSGTPVAAIEAVTTNPSTGQQTDVTVAALQEQPLDEILHKVNDEFPIRIGSALYSKLGKAYWDLPHCKGLPFVLAVGPFHEAGSMTYIDQSLARFLYGMDQSAEWIESRGVLTRHVPIRQHEFDGKVIPSEFFRYPAAEHVSAVVYGNPFSVSRFFRLAAQVDGWPRELAGMRRGWYLDPDDGPSEFFYELGDPQAPKETWAQGVTVFHNPKAIYPLVEGALRSTCEFRQREGFVSCEVRGFHPLTSFMMVGRKGRSKRKRRPRRRKHRR